MGHVQASFSVLALILLNFSCSVSSKLPLAKRALPTNSNCDPRFQACRKGDWVSEEVADCEYHGPKITCNAIGDHTLSWIVDEDKNNACLPSQGLQFTCGDPNTHTRCVCNDGNVFYRHFRNAPLLNQCKCQYWPAEDIGVQSPAFCTGYYTGGRSKVHHWICCNNCQDREENTCDGKTWQGGSHLDYCGACGESTGKGRVKYYFNCGSCEDQYRCEKECNSPAWMKWPGLCWLWADCFIDCCLRLPHKMCTLS